jgi:hypothetical protein
MAFNNISAISWQSVLPFIITYVVFSGVRVSWYLVFLCVCIVHRCLSYLFWPLCCLFFFDLRILTSPLAFSNSLIGGGNGVPWEKYRPATCHWQTLSPNVISSTLHQHVLYFFFLPSYSALLRFTACEFHFGCFKIFFQLIWRTCNYLKGHTIKMKN